MTRPRAAGRRAALTAALGLAVLAGIACPAAAGDDPVPQGDDGKLPAPSPVAGRPRAADMAGTYSGLIEREASGRGLPPAVADAVAFVESGYDPRAVGAVGELGLMQVLPSTAAMLGHRGPAEELLDPSVNVRFGVAYLAGAWKLAHGDLCRTLMKYRAGHGELRMTARSVDYCRRARDRLAATGSPLAQADLPSVAPPRAGMAIAVRRSRNGDRPSMTTRSVRSWAEHVARVRAVEARIDRIMSGG